MILGCWRFVMCFAWTINELSTEFVKWAEKAYLEAVLQERAQ